MTAPPPGWVNREQPGRPVWYTGAAGHRWVLFLQPHEEHPLRMLDSGVAQVEAVTSISPAEGVYWHEDGGCFNAAGLGVHITGWKWAEPSPGPARRMVKVQVNP